MNAYQQLSCYPEVPDTLGRLRQHGLGTAILSNGSFEMLEAGVRNSSLEELLDGVFLLKQLGCSSRIRKFIKLAVDQLGCDPQEILFFFLKCVGRFRICYFWFSGRVGQSFWTGSGTFTGKSRS